VHRSLCKSRRITEQVGCSGERLTSFGMVDAKTLHTRGLPEAAHVLAGAFGVKLTVQVGLQERGWKGWYE
jgi:hypothetical protein